MNAVLVVGHPASSCSQVWQILRRRGVADALPAKRHRMLPEDITSALCKAHECPEIGELGKGSDVVQLPSATVWDALALDLMLGNIDQKIWGWMDARAVFALDYWAASMPNLKFILVYDNPQRVVERVGGAEVEENGSFDPRYLMNKLDDWAAFNSALIQFHLRHPDRAMLVHARELLCSADEHLEKVQGLLGASDLSAGIADVVPSAAQDASEASEQVPQSEGQAAASASLHDTLVERPDAKDAPDMSAAAKYLANAVVLESSEAMETYEELQSIADIPFGGNYSASGQDAAITAWFSFLRLRESSRRMKAGPLEEKRVNKVNAKSMGDLDKSAGIDRSLSVSTRQGGPQRVVEADTGEVAKMFGSKGRHVGHVAFEGGLLLEHLHQAQEELERVYLRANELERRAKSAEGALKKKELEAYNLSVKAAAMRSEKDQRIDRLKSIRFGKEKRIRELKEKLEAARDELKLLESKPVDLSTVPGRVMLRVSAKRAIGRLVPVSLIARKQSIDGSDPS